MIVHEVEQGTDDWYAVRTGVLTASEFGKIITAKTMKLSSQAAELENKIVAQILTGDDEREFCGNGYTERGKEYEPEAVSLYEMLRDVEAQTVGFITNDEGTLGCSPDRLIGEDGGLEIKCPGGKQHIASLLAGSIADDHKPQVQGCLLVTGRKWWDVMSYHPKLPPSIIRVERDEEYVAALSAAVDQMLINIQTKIKQVKGE